MIDPRLGWFAIGALLGAVLMGWPWHSRFSRYSRRGTNPPPPGRKPPPPAGPPMKPQPTGPRMVGDSIKPPPIKPQFPPPREIREDFL